MAPDRADPADHGRREAFQPGQEAHEMEHLAEEEAEHHARRAWRTEPMKKVNEITRSVSMPIIIALAVVGRGAHRLTDARPRNHHRERQAQPDRHKQHEQLDELDVDASDLEHRVDQRPRLEQLRVRRAEHE